MGVDRNDNDSIIRKKWIKLNKEHHPDNLIAKGMPQEFINQSNKELASINLAYDKIKKQKRVSLIPEELNKRNIENTYKKLFSIYY